MYGISFFTIALCVLAVAPLILMIRVLAAEARRRNEALLVNPMSQWAGGKPSAAEAQIAVVSNTGVFERTRRHLRETARCEVDHALCSNVHVLSGTSTAGALHPNAFEYTIKRHCGVKQKALNMGGFSQVPLMLYDRAGNCFTVHRRLSLN